jgi:hypothetical protein
MKTLPIIFPMYVISQINTTSRGTELMTPWWYCLGPRRSVCQISPYRFTYRDHVLLIFIRSLYGFNFTDRHSFFHAESPPHGLRTTLPKRHNVQGTSGWVKRNDLGLNFRTSWVVYPIFLSLQPLFFGPVVQWIE